jgi:uncharacterized protein (TIGR01777 family)
VQALALHDGQYALQVWAEAIANTIRMKLVIAGATGMIGRAVTEAALLAGHEVAALARKPLIAAALMPAGVLCIAFNDEKDNTWKQVISDADAIINLAGEPIGGRRWNPAFKERLVRSRVGVTRRVVDAIAEANRLHPKPRALINASAVGYYGDCADEAVTEERGPGADFLAELCVKWEEEALRSRSSGVRVVLMRIGLVLAQTGVLQKMLYPLPVRISPFKLGLGGPIGSGRQWMPWVHIDDVAGLFLFASANSEAEGAINLTAPNPVTNVEFARALGRVLDRPAVLHVPAFVLRAIVGEFADALLGGQRAIPETAQRLGYTFSYTDLEEALKQLL